LCHVVKASFRGENAKGRHAKNRQMVILADFRLATFRPARQRYDKQGRKRERSPRENPPNVDFFVFLHGDLSPRHTKVRNIPCVAFSATVCRIFAWRGERSPCENPPKSPFGGFRVATFRVFAPKTRLYDMAQISHHSGTEFTRVCKIDLFPRDS